MFPAEVQCSIAFSVWIVHKNAIYMKLRELQHGRSRMAENVRISMHWKHVLTKIIRNSHKHIFLYEVFPWLKLLDGCTEVSLKIWNFISRNLYEQYIKNESLHNWRT